MICHLPEKQANLAFLTVDVNAFYSNLYVYFGLQKTLE